MKSEDSTSDYAGTGYNYCDSVPMNYKRSLLILAMLVLAHVAFCQNTISGNLVDENAAYIPFARISLTEIENKTTFICQSGFDGEFKIDSLSTGRYTMEFSAIGYKSSGLEFDLNGDTVINRTLVPGPELLEEIEVVGYEVPLIDRDDQSLVQVKLVPKDCDLDTVQRPGRLTALEAYKFLINYLTYPEYSIAQLEQGWVGAAFKIDSTGTVRALRIEKSVSECLDNQVISALGCMPKVVMRKKLPNGQYSEPEGLEGFKEGEYFLPVRFELQ